MDKHRASNENHAAKLWATVNGEALRPFCFGVAGWFVLHTLFWGALELIGKQMGPGGIILVSFAFMPVPANIITLVLLFARPAGRPKALGALSALAVNSLATLVVTPDVGSLFRILMMMPFFFP